jgi:hypothetical protein
MPTHDKATYVGPGGRESVPDSLKPPPGYRPELTPLQRARLELDVHARTRAGLVPIGRPLSPRSVRMLGRPCPGGWASDNGYCKHACRCEQCREAHRVKRLRRLRRARAAA